MTASLKGDVALVTGAGGGIGSGVALAFAAGGADLCLTDLRVVPQVAERCAALGARVIDAPTDVTDGAKVRALVAAAERELGKVDIVVNVAGTVSFGTAEELPDRKSVV